LFNDTPYNPLGYYGITIKDNVEELFDYLNVATLAEETNQDNKKEEYTSYMFTTHGRKPNILKSNDDGYFQNYFSQGQTEDEKSDKRVLYKAYIEQSQMQ